MGDPTTLEAILAALPRPTARVTADGGVREHNRAWAEIACPFGHLEACGEEQLRLGGEGVHRCGVTHRAWRWRAPALDGGSHLVELEDVTDVERVSERERRLADALRGTDDGIFEWDLRDGTVVGNDRLCTMLGYEPGALAMGADWEAICHPDDRASIMDALKRHLRGETSMYSVVVRLRHADGTYRFIDDRGRVVSRDAEGRALRLAGAHRDITEHKLLERRFLANDRMASLGRLAAGLAHEVNNPLGYVIGNLDLITRDLAKLEPASRERAAVALAMAKEGALRVRDIIRDLQALSRAQRMSDSKLLDPAEVLEPALRMLEGQLADRARVTVAIDDVPIVHASPAQLAQVVLNVLTAVRAHVAPGDPDRQGVHVHAFMGDVGQVCLRVTHEAPADLPPPGPTEPGQQDIALGVVAAIVEELRGTVRVERAGSRMCVEVELPAAELEGR